MKFKAGDKVKCLEGWGNHLIDGKIYTVRDIHDCESLYITGIAGNWHHKRFEFAKEAADTFLDFEKAGSFLGKEVLYDGKWRFVPNSLGLYKDLPAGRGSIICNEYALKHGDNFIVLLNDNTTVPMELATLAPQECKVKLNSDYTATVTKETIKVGCQTFPVSILKDLQKALESLN